MHCSRRCADADWYVFDGQPVHTKSAVLLCFTLTNSPGLHVEIGKHSRLAVAVNAFDSYSVVKSHTVASTQTRFVDAVTAFVWYSNAVHATAALHAVDRWEDES